MDRQDDLAHRLVDVGDDVGDERSEESLARAHGHTWCVPGGIEILGQPGKVWRSGRWIRRPHRLQSRLARLDPAERFFPAPLELSGDEAIVGIAGGIAPFRERGFIAGLL